MRFKNDDEEKEMITINEAGKYLGIGRHAVLNAINSKRLNAYKNERKWAFTLKDLEEYKKRRHDRAFSKVNGEPLYDKSKGEFSIKEASELIPCPIQHLYYAARTNKICTSKKRCSWIVKTEDIVEYRKVMRLGKKKVT
jgi:excisionase family DNA binding protein